MEGFNMDGMSAQAQQIWSMLDDMAQNNPAAYRNFIDKQLKEGKEQVALPEPHMCVQVLLLTNPKQPLFVNFCSWNRIPEPKTPEDAVPVSGTRITHEVDDKGKHSLASVAFNPKVLTEFGREAKNPADTDTLIQLALDYIEHEQNVKVSRSYRILPVDTPHKGDLTLVQMSFTKLLHKGADDLQNDGKNGFESSNAGSAGPLDKDSILSQLSNIAVSDSPTYSRTRSNKGHNYGTGGEPSVNIFSEEKKQSQKKGLIQELDSSRLPAPKHSLEPTETDSGRVLILKVNLPDVKGVSECELDISEDDVELTVPGRYELKLKLPSCIDEDESCAKFSKKLSTLTVTMPMKS